MDHSRSTRRNPSLVTPTDNPENLANRNPSDRHEESPPSFETARPLTDNDRENAARLSRYLTSESNAQDVDIPPGYITPPPEEEPVEEDRQDDNRDPHEQGPDDDDEIYPRGELPPASLDDFKAAIRLVLREEKVVTRDQIKFIYKKELQPLIVPEVESTIEDLLSVTKIRADSNIRSELFDLVAHAVENSVKRASVKTLIGQEVGHISNSDEFITTVTNHILTNGALMETIGNHVLKQTAMAIDNLDIADIVERTMIIQQRVLDKYLPGNKGALPLEAPKADVKKSKSKMEALPPSPPNSDPSSSDHESSSDSDAEHTKAHRKKKTESKKAKQDPEDSGKPHSAVVPLTDSNKYVAGLTIVVPVNDLFRKALDYSTYRLNDVSTVNITKYTSKYIRRLTSTMKSRTFDQSEPVSILLFLEQFQSACNDARINEGTAMWLLPHFMKKPADVSLNSRLRLYDKDHTAVEGILTTYPAVINYLLSEYAADEVIAEAVSDINNLKQKDKQTAAAYADALLTRAYRCGRVYNESRLRGIFVEGVHDSLQQSMREYWGRQKNATLTQLARHADSLRQLQTGSTLPTTSIDKIDKNRQGRNKSRQSSALTVDTSSTGTASNLHAPSAANWDALMAILRSISQHSNLSAASTTSAPTTVPSINSYVSDEQHP